MAEHVARLYRSIHAVVRRIPEGRVATYGQIAELAGLPGGARVAGAAMKMCDPADRLPWQRVIGKAGKNRGRIAIHDPVGAAVQRQLLEDEGVTINDSGLVALDRFGWLPGDSARAKPRKGKPLAKRAGRAASKPWAAARRPAAPARASSRPRAAKRSAPRAAATAHTSKQTTGANARQVTRARRR